MSDQIGEVIVYIIWALIKSIVHLDDLKQCPAPLHVFITGIWIIIAGVIVGFALSTQGNVAQTIGILMLGLAGIGYCIWSLVGLVMYSITLVKNAACIPDDITVGLAVFMIANLLLQLCLLVVVCKAGMPRLLRIFKGARQVQDNLNNLVNGRVRAEDLIRRESAIDTYALFDKEKLAVMQYCSVEFQVRRGESSEDETEDCVICYSAFNEGDSVILYPVCKHKYHADCLMHWLKKRTTCPICRRGIRSSLYQHVERSQLRQTEEV